MTTATIFVSSVQKELAEERRALKAYIEGDPLLRRFFTAFLFEDLSEVKCLHFHGTEVQKPIPSYQIYKGTVFELVDQAVDFVMSKIARRVGTRALGPQAPVDY